MTKNEILNVIATRESAGIELKKLLRKYNLDVVAVHAACEAQLAALRVKLEADSATFAKSQNEAIDVLEGVKSASSITEASIG